MAQLKTELRSWNPGIPNLLAGVLLGAAVWGIAIPANGQGTGFSRWSSANPPTPTQVASPTPTLDDVPRRFPPVDEPAAAESTPAEQWVPSFGARSPEKLAAKPQASSTVTPPAAPVDWSNPSVVIGPEARPVSHEEEVAPAQKHSRFSNPQASQTGSRFTQAEVAPVDSNRSADEKSGKSIFARVFDEANELEAGPSEEAETASTANFEPENESAESDLSPIFACRLLGLRTTKTEAAQ